MSGVRKVSYGTCNYHASAIRHISHLLTTELATTLVCSLISTHMDYCNSLLHGAPTSSIRKLQHVQNNTARIILQAPRRSHAWPLLCQLHRLLVRHRIDYKLAVKTYRLSGTNVPQSASHVAPACTNITLIGRSAAHQAFHQNRVCKACIPTLCTDRLELATEINHQLRLAASV